MKSLSFAGGMMVLALGLVACGDDSGGTGGAGTGGGSTTATGATTGATTGTTTATTTTATTATTTTTTSTSSSSDGGGGSTSDGGGGSGSTSDGGGGSTGDGGATGNGGGGGDASSVQEVSCDGADVVRTITNVGMTGFSPDTLPLFVGDIIMFAPTGSHTMTADNGEFDTAVGATVCLQFSAAGDFPYHCAVHSGMQGTVTVQ